MGLLMFLATGQLPFVLKSVQVLFQKLITDMSAMAGHQKKTMIPIALSVWIVARFLSEEKSILLLRLLYNETSLFRCLFRVILYCFADAHLLTSHQ